MIEIIGYIPIDDKRKHMYIDKQILINLNSEKIINLKHLIH